jgi:CubicO group peptidase (beta-lactamase class C family)
MRNFQRIGAFGSLLNACISITNIVIVFGILGAGVVTEPMLVIEQVRTHPFPLVLLELLKILSAISTLLVVFAIHQRLNVSSYRTIQFGTLAGIASVLLLLAAGTIGMIAIGLASRAEGNGQLVGMSAYFTYSTIINRLGLAAVLVNGIWYLLVCFTGIAKGYLPRNLGYVGVPLGLASLTIFVLPPIVLLVLILGLIWSIWLGTFLFRAPLAQGTNATNLTGGIQMKRQSKRNTKLLIFIGFLAVFLLALSLGLFQVQRTGGLKQLTAPVNYPTQGWQTSAPEEQGFASARLAEGLTAIKGNRTLIHSLTIVRHGSVILDATFYPYSRASYHDIASVTKSVMTTLIGIAADQGKLNLDQPAISFFPTRTIANMDARKQHITVRNLVSMSSGLDCTAADGEKTLEEMKDSADWIQFVLDRKAIYEPGTHFEYCSPGMHLLSAILQQATGMTALEYARINLFGPLGIQDVYWPLDPQGYNHGWGDLALYPQDMAKIGYLFLHQGGWEGKQIVSREWIRQATRRQMDTGELEDDDYGYGWWVSRPDADIPYSMASGRGGQRILVVPAMDMVLVTTGGGFDFGEIEQYIRAAIGNLEEPLPANPAGVEQLKAVVTDLGLAPAAHAVSPLPETADAISGQVFVLEQPNAMEVKSLQLDFADAAEAILRVNKVKEADAKLVRIGLDGVYRASGEEEPIIARGEWIDGTTFVIDYAEGLGLDAYTLTMNFNADDLHLEVNDISHGRNLNLEAQTRK